MKYKTWPVTWTSGFSLSNWKASKARFVAEGFEIASVTRDLFCNSEWEADITETWLPRTEPSHSEELEDRYILKYDNHHGNR